MAMKDEAIGFIKAFVTMIQNQFSYTVKTIRSDNPLEFTKSDTALEFFASNGILHQTSCIQTPQQNEVVERKHKHLLEVSRALLFQSKLPLKFWGDCVLTATHIINRLPTVLLQNKSPFEVLYGKMPSFDHLRVFGCLCYMSTTKQGRDKFQPTALPCVFLDIPMEKWLTKSWILRNTKFIYPGILFFMKQFSHMLTRQLALFCFHFQLQQFPQKNLTPFSKHNPQQSHSA